MSLRNCQKLAIEKYEEITKNNAKKYTNISMCTGSGKTRVIQEITKYQNKRILIVFPWLALLKQFWEDRLNPFRSHICVRYYATEGILRSVKKLNMDALQEESYIILTTYKSAPDIYAKISDENAVDLIIHDEAHRAERDIYSAAFAKIVDNVKHYLNLSATLPNKDGYEADYKYSLLRGIKDGVVRDFNMHMFLCVDIEREQSKTFIEIVEILKKMHPEVKLLVYTAEANTDEFNSSSVKTFLSLNGKEVERKGWWIQGLNKETDKERDSILKDFQVHREVSILVSCKTISEGVDLKNANCMMAWDASKSPIDNIQRVGRVLRLYKNANGTIATKEKQTPSTIMIPIFLTRSKFEDCGGDRQRIHDTLSQEISLNCRGNFMPFVEVCTALKSELADEDEDLFNELINMPVKVKSSQNIVECISSHLKKEKDVILEEIADSLDDEEIYEMIMENDWDEENSNEVLTALAETQNIKLIVNDGECKSQYGNSENVVVVEKNEKDDGYKIVKGKKAEKEKKTAEHINNRTDLSFSSDAKIFLGLDTAEADVEEKEFVIRKINAEVQPDACWEKRRTAWEEFYQKYEKTPIQTSKKKEEKSLGYWASTQKSYYKKGKLLPEREEKLNNTDGWVWDKDLDKIWNDHYQKWVEFYQKNDKRPSQYSKNQEEKILGSWTSNQKVYYKKGKLSPVRIDILNNTNGWVWEDNKEERWNETYQKWVDFYQENGVIPSKVTENNKEKILSKWAQHQKENYKKGELLIERERKLNTTNGWRWDELEDKWDENYQKWVEFYQNYEKTPVSSSKNKEEKFLGNWASFQKKNFQYQKSCLTQERINILNKTDGWIWKIDLDKIWNETHQKWIEFYQKYKKKPVQHSKNQEEKILCNWAETQKNNYKNKDNPNYRKKISQERIDILNNTDGWEWKDNKEERWNETYQKWVEFYQKYGKIPSHGSKNKEENSLANWTQDQKTNYKKGNLSQKRRNILNNIEGWIWEDIKEKLWNENYQKWVDFYQKNSKIPYPTSKNKEEKILGNWTSTQRYNYKKGLISQERLDILNKTEGWKWSKDDDEIQSVSSSDSSIKEDEATQSETSVQVSITKKVRPSKKKIKSIDYEPKGDGSSMKHQMGLLEKYHQRFKKMNAATYVSKITKEEFNAYHDIADDHDSRDKEGEGPNDKMAQLLKKFNRKSYSAIDLGCGRNRFKTRPEVNKMNWTSVDAVAIDDSVIEADMANLPFEEEEFDFAIMSRALWAVNYQDVLKETARILKHNGTLLICEAYSRWCKKDANGENILPQAIQNAGFSIVNEEGTFETEDFVNTWQYIIARKI